MLLYSHPIDGLKCGSNTKAAIIRLGLMEMKKFSQNFYDGVKDETYFESCGIADLITVRRLLVEEETVQDPDYHVSSHSF